MPLRCVLHPFVFFSVLCMAWMLSTNPMWNFKIFPKLTDTSPKWRHLWNLIFRSMPLRFVRFFFKFFVYGLNVIDQILCLFCIEILRFSLNWRTHPRTFPKWSHSLVFILHQVYQCLRLCLYYIRLVFILRQFNASMVCITSVCVFISSWCMAWMLSIKYFVFFNQILRFP